MDTPHNDKQRKSLFSHKLAQTLVGLIAVCFLIFCIRSPSTSGPSPFQTTSSEKETALKWIFITPYGETDSSYAELFLSQEDCTELAGTPVELSFCTIEKYLNMTASGISADVVTCWYTDANFKRLETTGTTWALQDLLNKEIPGFTLPENFIRWCGNFQGDVYAYPHTRTILSEDTSIKSAAAMIGRKDILEKIHWDSQQPLSKAYCLEQLKAVRKAYPELISCYVELPSLQQMFGVTADTGTAWEDPFFHPGTLESLEFMNTLFRERLLSRDVFTLSQESLLRQLQNGEIFWRLPPRWASCSPSSRKATQFGNNMKSSRPSSRIPDGNRHSATISRNNTSPPCLLKAAHKANSKPDCWQHFICKTWSLLPNRRTLWSAPGLEICSRMQNR